MAAGGENERTTRGAFATQNATVPQNQRYPPRPTTPASGNNNPKGANNKDAGFFFDAFGLDAKEIDNEVTNALEAIAGSNPDFSFFFNFNDDPGGAGDGSVASASPMSSVQSSRVSPTNHQGLAPRKSPTFWDDESDSSSFVPSVHSETHRNEEFSSTSQDRNGPSNPHRQPQFRDISFKTNQNRKDPPQQVQDVSGTTNQNNRLNRTQQQGHDMNSPKNPHNGISTTEGIDTTMRSN